MTSRGPSLMEGALALTAVALLAVGAVLVQRSFVDGDRRDRALADLTRLEHDVATAGWTVESLGELVEHGDLGSIPLDPWGGEYEYSSAGGCLSSRGPDGRPGTADDVVVVVAVAALRASPRRPQRRAGTCISE